jgi:hypothetical protein
MYRWNLCFVGICWRAHHLPYGKGSNHSLVRSYQLCGRSVLGLGLPFHEVVRNLAIVQPLFPRPSTPLFSQVRGSRSRGRSIFRMGPDPGIQSGTVLLVSLGCGLCLKTVATVCSSSGSRCTHSAEFWSIRIAASSVMDTPMFCYTDQYFGISTSPSSKTIGWDVRATS